LWSAAYDLAASGEFSKVNDIIQRLPRGAIHPRASILRGE
jgi:hypothetical protein